MQINYVINARLPTEKAHGYQVAKMCEAFANADVSVSIFHPKRVQPPALRGANLFDYYGVSRGFSLVPLATLDVMPWTRGKVQDAAYLLQAGSFEFSLTIALLARSLARKPRGQKVLYTRDQFALPLLLPLGRLTGQKVVYEAHAFPGPLGRRVAIEMFRRVDLLVVLTHQLKRMFIEAGTPEERIIVAPDAVDLKQFQVQESSEECRRRLALPVDRKIIGYVGRFQTMEQEKGIPELVAAMQYLVQGNQPSPLLLCVGGPLEVVPKYEAIARQCGVPLEQLRFVDRVPNVEVPYWIRACDVCTIPWAWTEFSAYYTSPMKLFEYMATGVPIVATDLPSIREVLRHDANAWLVEPGSPKALADGISSILSDNALGSRLANLAREEANRYTWELRASTILNRIEQIGRE